MCTSKVLILLIKQKPIRVREIVQGIRCLHGMWPILGLVPLISPEYSWKLSLSIKTWVNLKHSWFWPKNKTQTNKEPIVSTVFWICGRLGTNDNSVTGDSGFISLCTESEEWLKNKKPLTELSILP